MQINQVKTCRKWKRDNNTIDPYQLVISLVDSRDDKLSLIKLEFINNIVKIWLIYSKIKFKKQYILRLRTTTDFPIYDDST